MRSIRIEPYNPIWIHEYEKICEYLWSHICDIALDIVHTGSTSVPGLAAKPIIDFNIVIESYDIFPKITERLNKLGYIHDGDGGIFARERFKGGKRDIFMEYHMYVCPKDSAELERQILFRDYLCRNDDARDEYAILKMMLAENHKHDINAYIDGKHDFIMNIVKKAREQKGYIKSQNIFDNPVFFDGYKKLRDNPDNANLLMEKPALFSLIPDLTDKTVLDLGCGYGENCTAFKQLGAIKVTGVDISDKMLTIAKSETKNIEYIKMDMSDLSGIFAKYDVIFSSLAVHYIEDFKRLCAQIAGLLYDKGIFIFSQEHPLTTAPIKGANWTTDNEGNRLHYNLTDYGRAGKRETTWIVDGVIKFHRSFSDIFNILIESGFDIEKVLEPLPTDEAIKRNGAYLNQYDKPNYLLVRARKK